MKNFPCFVALYALLTVGSTAPAAEQVPALRIWDDVPATEWVEAYPLGNGRIGAMVFGGVEQEHMQLNEDTLYSSEPGQRDLPLDVRPGMALVREAHTAGDYRKAHDYITKHWLGRAQPCYQPLGDLWLDFSGDGPVSEYRRELDLGSAIARTSFVRDGVRYTREAFISQPDQVLVMRLTADAPGRLTFKARLTSPHPTGKCDAPGKETLRLTGQAPGLALRRELDWVERKGDTWKYPEIWNPDGTRKFEAAVLYGDGVDGKGMLFETRLRVLVEGGEVQATDDALDVAGASAATLLLAVDTSYNGFDKSPSREGVDPSVAVEHDLNAAAKKDYTALRDAHITDYRVLFDRVTMELGNESAQSALPTRERVARFANGGDPALAALYFQFGRYLMISGSRPGTQPLNLQGIWNDQIIPPWASAYTTNINAEMNYWPAEVANLAECHEPYFRMIRELAANGQRSAEEMFGNRGWVAHHNTSIWRGAQPVDNDALFSFWPVAQGWLTRDLWEHYAFGRDETFLRETAYPLMKGAALFFLDWLVEDEAGWLITPTGTSPENRFLYGKRESSGQAPAPTMDMAIIRENFTYCIEAARILGVDEELSTELAEKLPKLFPYQIGARGQLQEWYKDFKESEPQHRHISHLYGLHPGDQITPETPELFAAARKTLELRGDEATGWSMGWKINFWARMRDGDHAHKLMANLLTPARTAPNLFCLHPPFQIDGNFGGTAGIAEMLLQSHSGEIHLLPALPEAWPKGAVTGLRARGGLTVDLTWAEGVLQKATLTATVPGKHRIRYGGHETSVTLEEGESIVLDGQLKPGGSA